MAKKDFRSAVKDYSNPANAFLTSAPKPKEDREEVRPKTKDAPRKTTAEVQPITGEEGRPPARGQWTHRAQHIEGSESYTKRVQLLMRPSTHAKAKQIAAAQGLSLNNFINGLIEGYVDQEGAEA